jgi:ferritin-like metal-binding protein YciE
VVALPALKRVAPVELRTGSVQEREVMALFSKDIRTMDDLFVHQLRDIYYAEKQIVKALPKMIDKASDSDLKTGLRNHFDQSKNHVGRVERVFEMYDREPRTVDCPAIDGIIKEANEVIGDVEDKDVLDAAIIAAAQAVEHYEIARYGSLIAWAKQLGRDDCASVLAETLEEEKAADEKLTEVARSRVNMEAA